MYVGFFLTVVLSCSHTRACVLTISPVTVPTREWSWGTTGGGKKGEQGRRKTGPNGWGGRGIRESIRRDSITVGEKRFS